MAVKISVTGTDLGPHFFNKNSPTLKPDAFGKLGGYRVYPPSNNLSQDGIFYHSLEDVAGHLRMNPEWGLRFSSATMPSPTLRYENIEIDGIPRR